MSTPDIIAPHDGDAVYGRHLMMRLGAIEGDDLLDDPAGLERYLGDLVTGIGMRILSGPHVSTEDHDGDRYGHSGVVVLYESHAAIHTYPRRRSMFLDVFSCMHFEVGDVCRLTKEAFGSFDVIESRLLDRGLHWVGDAASELAAWQTGR